MRLGWSISWIGFYRFYRLTGQEFSALAVTYISSKEKGNLQTVVIEPVIILLLRWSLRSVAARRAFIRVTLTRALGNALRHPLADEVVEHKFSNFLPILSPEHGFEQVCICLLCSPPLLVNTFTGLLRQVALIFCYPGTNSKATEIERIGSVINLARSKWGVTSSGALRVSWNWSCVGVC